MSNDEEQKKIEEKLKYIFKTYSLLEKLDDIKSAIKIVEREANGNIYRLEHEPIDRKLLEELRSLQYTWEQATKYFEEYHKKYKELAR